MKNAKLKRLGLWPELRHEFGLGPQSLTSGSQDVDGLVAFLVGPCRPAGFPRKGTYQDWQTLRLRLRPGLVAELRYGMGWGWSWGRGLGCGLEEEVARSNLLNPAVGFCDKVLVPADYFQAIYCWVYFEWSGHSVRFRLQGKLWMKELDPTAVKQETWGKIREKQKRALFKAKYKTPKQTKWGRKNKVATEQRNNKVQRKKGKSKPKFKSKCKTQNPKTHTRRNRELTGTETVAGKAIQNTYNDRMRSEGKHTD